MPRFEILTSEKHPNITVAERYGEDCGNNVHMIPVVVTELAPLIAHYPVVIGKDGETGGFMLAAVTGVVEGENLFLEGQKWGAAYQPLHAQRGPFAVQESGDPDNPSLLVRIDLDDPRVTEDGGERLFDDDTNQTEYMRRKNAILATIVDGMGKTDAFLSECSDNDLIEPVQLQLSFKDQSNIRFEGLYSINQDKLAAMTGEALENFHAAGHLRAAHYLTGSIGQIQNLVMRKNARL